MTDHELIEYAMFFVEHAERFNAVEAWLDLNDERTDQVACARQAIYAERRGLC